MSGTQRGQGILIAPPFARLSPTGTPQEAIAQFNQAMAQVERSLAQLQAVVPLFGATVDRPQIPAGARQPIGQTFFDTTLGIPIWWAGTQWVNASGAPV